MLVIRIINCGTLLSICQDKDLLNMHVPMYIESCNLLLMLQTGAVKMHATSKHGTDACIRHDRTSLRRDRTLSGQTGG